MTRHLFARRGKRGISINEKRNREIDFIRAEVHTGLTFARIALGSRYKEKADRNRANARKAYDTLLRFMPRDNATGAWDEIRAQIAELRSHLQQLGETV